MTAEEVQAMRARHESRNPFNDSHADLGRALDEIDRLRAMIESFEADAAYHGVPRRKEEFPG